MTLDEWEDVLAQPQLDGDEWVDVERKADSWLT